MVADKIEALGGPPPRWWLWGTVFLAFVVSVAASAGWILVVVLSTREQPLTITACTPESYEAPEGTEPGPPQEECERWFSEPNDQYVVDGPIRVEGQVCLEGDRPVAYHVQVGFEPISAAEARLLAIDVPIIYEPGCQPAYSFPFDVPSVITAGKESGESAGQWRIIGRAYPSDPESYRLYQWEATETVEFIAP